MFLDGGRYRMADGPQDARLWAPFVEALPVDGGSISVISRSGLSSTVSVSDPTAGRLDALHLQLGEGPRWTAFRSRASVLVPDAGARGAHELWPLFGDALGTTAVRGVFSIPLMLGLLIVGVADLYSDDSQTPWSPGVRTRAAAIAASSAAPAVRLAISAATSSEAVLPLSVAELRREVHQATGVVMVQLEVGPDDALARLQARAFSDGRPLLDVARDVLLGRADLREDAG